MKVVSLDIETTGLDPKRCQILEIGAVIGDTEGDGVIDTYHTFVLNDHIKGEPYALAMNQDIIKIIANKENYPDDKFTSPCHVAYDFLKWLKRNGLVGETKPSFAGKNFSGFDLQFLKRRIHFWKDTVPMHYRHLDVGSMYFKKDMAGIPSLDECRCIAGLPGTISHRAIDDARLVLELIRRCP